MKRRTFLTTLVASAFACDKLEKDLSKLGKTISKEETISTKDNPLTNNLGNDSVFDYYLLQNKNIVLKMTRVQAKQYSQKDSLIIIIGKQNFIYEDKKLPVYELKEKF